MAGLRDGVVHTVDLSSWTGMHICTELLNRMRAPVNGGNLMVLTVPLGRLVTVRVSFDADVTSIAKYPMILCKVTGGTI